MPKRTDISSILIIGAGPIVIGQACEFDYSGTQAIKALKEEGYRIVLVNSNPATIMTDPELADATYVEPITPEIVAKIIEKERPDAVLPTMGGQTALNTALALFNDGTLEKYGVPDDRRRCRGDRQGRGPAEIPRGDGQDRPGKRRARASRTRSTRRWRRSSISGCPRSSARASPWAAPAAASPITARNSSRSSLGGLDASPTTEVLIEELLLGWKEYEMEVVRDRNDNCIIICSIENVDPMGVHTGDSITVAPALTLTDKEYQIMRNASIAVLREIGVETGGSNVQFAVNPKDGRLVVIEMNPRVSRSSALASKATGFPIAKVAAKLAVGYTLDEIDNDITGATPATLRADDRLCRHQDPALRLREVQGRRAAAVDRDEDRSAKSWRSAATSTKACRRRCAGWRPGCPASTMSMPLVGAPRDEIEAALSRPTPDRLLVAAQALREGFTVDEIHAHREIRSLVPRADRRDRRRRGGGLPRGPAARRAGHAAAEGDGLFRQAARLAGAQIGQSAAACDRGAAHGRA